MSSFVSTLLLLVCGLQSDTFLVSEASLPVPPACVPANQAYVKAKALRQTLSSLTPKFPAVVQLERLVFLRWTISFGTSTVTLDPQTGKLVSFLNDDWMKRRKVARDPFESVFANDQLLIDRARIVAAQIDFPDSIEVSHIRRGVLDPNNWGSAAVQYSPSVHGRRVLGRGGSITFDEKDGSIVSITNDLQFTIETLEPVISEIQARNRAKAAYEQHISSEDRWPMDNDPLALFYVPREKNFGSQRPVQEYPETKVRIAYVVSFGSDAVWIDAVNGQVLGGTKGKRPPRP